MSNRVVPKKKNAMAIANELSAVNMAAMRFQTSLAAKAQPLGKYRL
jgi:hypothetical protein